MSAFFDAVHYDGQSAVKRKVEVQVVGPQFYLAENERRSGPFAFADVEYVTKQGEADVYGLKDQDGWRLMLSGPVPSELTALLPAPRKYGGWVDRLGLGKAAIAFALTSAAAVAIVLFSPQWLAPLIPDSVDDRLGDALVGDFGGRFCSTPAGDAALQKLVASLDDNPQDLRVEVANIDMLNAVALPGGNVILFDGLLKQARSPDEVAGVLAHEIGHVRQKHVMQALLRQMGLAVVLGGIDGNKGALVNNMLAMSYSRNSEAEADAHSMKVLGNANISPIAAAPDFTDWDFDAADRATIAATGRIERPSDYGYDPMVITQGFWQSGQNNLRLTGKIGIDCPVRLIHGQCDPDVPWGTSLKLARALRSSDVQTIWVKDGDHRLSRDQDIALLIDVVAKLAC